MFDEGLIFVQIFIEYTMICTLSWKFENLFKFSGTILMFK